MIAQATEPVERIRLFVSSSDEMRPQRRFFKALEDGVREALVANGSGVDIYVQEWEFATPGRVLLGAGTNDRNVENARTATLTCCLLGEGLGPGTLEELEGALEQITTDVAILWDIGDEEQPDTPLGRYLAGLEGQDRVHITRTRRAGPLGMQRFIVQLLFDQVLAAESAMGDREVLRERRP